jgi:hypothetical protein
MRNQPIEIHYQHLDVQLFSPDALSALGCFYLKSNDLFAAPVVRA